MVHKTGIIKGYCTGVILLIFGIQIAPSEKLTAQQTSRGGINIGLMLSQDPEKETSSMESLFTVRFVIQKVNEQGGINGEPLRLYYKTGEGDWGISSKRSVELIFDDDVSAIIGSLDGRNAHLTQMAITKAEVVYIATRSADPTLSEINIPWFFRVIPSDKQQAEALIQSIFTEHGLKQITVIHSDRYDDRMAATTFSRLATEVHQYSIETYEYDHQQLTRFSLQPMLAANQKSEGIVIFGSDNDVREMLTRMEPFGVNIPLFLPLKSRTLFTDSTGSTNVSYLCPGDRTLPFDPPFLEMFYEKFDRQPGLTAAYSYDGIQILIESIKYGGSEREKIRDALKSGVEYRGVTGQVGFHTNGDRVQLLSICTP